MTAAQLGPRRLMKILVPTDFSPCSVAAVDYARFLAPHFGAEIDLLYVWNPRTEGVVGGRSIDFADGLDRWAMEQRRTEDQGANVRVRGRVEFGELCATILRVAEADDFDLIVMGLHGRARVSHLFNGYVARKVALHATCPVVTVRASMTEDTDDGLVSSEAAG